MQVGIILLCRYNSKRLPGKILKPIAGKPIIAYIMDQLSIAVSQKSIIVCTSENGTDDPIAAYCDQQGYNCFRGSLENVSRRFLDCGLHYGFDYLTRINGDNLFINHEVLQKMITSAKSGKYNFITNVKDRTFPKGMSIEIVKRVFYQDYYENHFSSSGHFEHVTQYFYQKSPKIPWVKYFYNKTVPQAAGIQLAIDTQKDFEMAERMIDTFDKNIAEYNLAELYKVWEKVHG